MKDNIILPNEMNHFCLRILPVFFPVIRKLFCCRYISYWCIEPYIEYFPFCPFNGNGNTPVKIAAYSPGLEALVDPRFALPVNIGFPVLLMPFQYPLL